MAGYEPMYIEKDATVEEVVEAFGKFLHKANYLMRQLDSQNVKRISTDITEIKSDDGATKIDGTQIVMLDGKGVERLRLGQNKDNGTFDFILKNNRGNTTLKLSSTGDAVFSGDVTGSIITGSTIDVEEDASVGNNLYLGKNDNSETATKKIVLFENTSDDKKATILAERQLDGTVDLKLIASRISFATTEGMRGSNDEDIITSTYDSYVEIDGVKHYVKWK